MDQKFGEFSKFREKPGGMNFQFHGMNWAQFKDLLCYLCFAGNMLASWSLTQE